MKISELPEELQELALQRQRECKNIAYDKETDDLFYMFHWDDTPERASFWNSVYHKSYNVYNYDCYPKKKEIQTFKFC